MIRRILRYGAFLLALLAPSMAHAQASFVVMGGVSAPMSRLGELADLGYNLAGGLNLGATALPFGVRVEAGYNSFGFKNASTNARLISITGNGIFNVGPGNDAPYLIGGVGAYNRSVSGTAGTSNGRTAIGINAGGGLRFPLTGFTTFFEARYHVMLGNAADGTDYHFIPVTFGIAF